MASIDLATLNENIQGSVSVLSSGKFNTKEVLLDISDYLMILVKQVRYALNHLDGSNMPTIKTSLDGLTTKIEAINGDITTIKHTGAEISEQIENQKVKIGDEYKRLSEIIDQKTKEIDDRYKGKITAIEDNVSKVTKTADEINSTVKRRVVEFQEKIDDVKKLVNNETGKLDDKLGGQIRRITEQQSEISQKADKIESTVTENIKSYVEQKSSSNKEYVDGKMREVNAQLAKVENNQSKIIQKSDEIEHRVLRSVISYVDEETSSVRKYVDRGDERNRRLIDNNNQSLNSKILKVEEQQSKISQKADSIESTVTRRVEGVERNISDSERRINARIDGIPKLIEKETTSIKQTAKNIELKYEGFDSSIRDIRRDLGRKLNESDFSGRKIIAKINIDADGAVIQGDRVKLESNFNEIVSKDGRSRLIIGTTDRGRPALEYQLIEKGYEDTNWSRYTTPFSIAVDGVVNGMEKTAIKLNAEWLDIDAGRIGINNPKAIRIFGGPPRGASYDEVRDYGPQGTSISVEKSRIDLRQVVVEQDRF